MWDAARAAPFAEVRGRWGLLVAAVLFAMCVMYTRTGTEIAIGAADLLFLADCARRRRWDWAGSTIGRIAGVYWIWIMLCSIHAPWLGLHGAGDGASVQAALTVRFFVFTAAVADLVRRVDGASKSLLRTLAATAVFIAVVVWEQYFTGSNFLGQPRWKDGALTGPFFVPRAGPELVLILFPALLPKLAGLLESPRRRQRLAGLVLGMAALATVALIGQRMPMLLTLLGAAVAAGWKRQMRRPLLAAGAFAVALIAATPLISPPTFQKLVVHFGAQMAHFWRSDYGQLYIRAAAMGAQHPLTGLGFDGFRLHCHETVYQSGIRWLGVPAAADRSPGGCNIHPHNHYLEALTAGGVPGLAMFGVLVVCALGVLGRGLAEASAARAGCFIAVLLAFWPFASTSALFTVPNAAWIFLVAGIGFGLAGREAEARPAISGTA